jgi:hypothetical protein
MEDTAKIGNQLEQRTVHVRMPRARSRLKPRWQTGAMEGYHLRICFSRNVIL